MKAFFVVLSLGLISSMMIGCSGAQKAREAQREKLSQSSGFFCEFINGDDFKDIDVELNLSLAKRCDSAKPFSTSYYKNSSDVYGVLYCCSLAKKEPKGDSSSMKLDGEKSSEKHSGSVAVPKPEKPSKKDDSEPSLDDEDGEKLSTGTKQESATKESAKETPKETKPAPKK